MSKVIIYTAIFGEYDQLIEDQYQQDDDVEYICFTDNKELRSTLWKIIYCKPQFKNNQLNAKYYKVLSHKVVECDYSLWIDGNISITDNVYKLIEEYVSDKDICFHKHPSRDCIYKEAKTLIELNKGDPVKIKKQIDKYKKEDYPSNNGLNAGGVILRRHSEKIKRFNECWWREICNNSQRDQLSLNYILYKLEIDFNTFNFRLPSVDNPNPFFKYYEHIPFYKRIVSQDLFHSCYIYCYSKLGKKVESFLDNNNINISGIYDSDKKKVSKTDFIDLYNDSDVNRDLPVIVCSITYYTEIRGKLNKNGFSNVLKAI